MKSKLYVLLFLFIGLLFLDGCGTSGGDGDDDGKGSNGSITQTTTVSGTVLDINGDPIAEAQVVISSSPVIVTTDTNGNFSATVEVGSHNIVISKNSELIYSGTFTCYKDTLLSLGSIATDYGAVTFEELAGYWYGVVIGKPFYNLSFNIDSKGEITSYAVDDIDLGLTGSVTKEADQIYSFLFNDGMEAIVLADAAVNHAHYVDDKTRFGVVQKNISALPAYTENDVVGHWSGYGVHMLSIGDIDSTWKTSFQINNDLTFSGTDYTGQTFDGYYSARDLTYGGYLGTFSISGTDINPLVSFLSADKSFIANYGCLAGENGWSYPEDCFFESLNKDQTGGETVINWSGGVKMSYSYSGGVLSGLNVGQDILVTGESDDIELSAVLKMKISSSDIIDEQSGIFYVSSGNKYTVSFRVTLHEKYVGCISFGHENVIFLSSPSSSSGKSIGIDACYVSTALGEIQLK